MEKKDFVTEIHAVKPVLTRYALYLTGNKDSADELLQETIVRAYVKFDKFTPGTKFIKWITIIMKNLYINSVIRERSAVSYTDYMAMIKQIDNNTPEEELLVHDLENYINSMQPVLKETIKLRISGLSYIDIAKQLNLPITTVKNRLFIAKRVIRKRLKE